MPMTRVGAPGEVDAATPVSQQRRFRPDIQAMRALAVTLVVIFHLWPSALPGGYVGVDVFFVLSGFLMSSHLLHVENRSGKEVLDFWSRRIRRIIPVALFVLVFTLIAGRLLLPPTRWSPDALGVIASATFWENWNLAISSVQYLAADDAPTLTQHFWSLSVEEQFYLVWPLMFAAAALIAARLRASRLAWITAGITAVVVVSLLISIRWTAVEPGSAYFSTFTRVWELALGGLCAVLLPFVGRLKPLVRKAMMLLGLVFIIGSAAAYSTSTAFPGTAALVPTLGSALLIVGGSVGEWDRSVLVKPRWIQWTGNASYSIYLWHWPLFVLASFVLLDHPALIGPVALVLTIAFSALSLPLIEKRFRDAFSKKTPKQHFSALAVGIAVVVGLASLQLFEVSRNQRTNEQAASSLQSDRPECFGAAALVSGPEICPVTNTTVLIPTPTKAKLDKSDAYRDGCWSNEPFKKRPVCTYGNGPIKVALAGNSHAGQWLPTLQEVAKKRGWTITTYLVSRCNLTTLPLQFDTEAKTQACLDYGQWVLDQTKGKKFDLVITSERQSLPLQGATFEETKTRAVGGYQEYLKQWTSSGTKVIVLKDTPDPGRTIKNVPDCVAAYKDYQQRCSGTPTTWKWMDPLTDAASASGSGVDVIKMNQYLCTQTTCPPVIGSVVVYFDASHLTATFARTLTGYLDKKIAALT